jgi:hypothetical protein
MFHDIVQMFAGENERPVVLLKRIRHSGDETAIAAANGQHMRRAVFEPALIFVFVFLLPRPLAKDSPSIVTVRAMRAQELVDQLRSVLPISSEVQVAAVTYNPLVFSVQPLDTHKDHFLLKMEIGFLLMLQDDELRAAMGHELGHVWIYTHRPYLQTERAANIIGQQMVDRESLKKLYAKLWTYESASGVPIDDLLGPPPAASKAPKPLEGEPGP